MTNRTMIITDETAEITRRDSIGLTTDLAPVIAPICPECNADGQFVRGVRKMHQCLGCGHEWRRE